MTLVKNSCLFVPVGVINTDDDTETDTFSQLTWSNAGGAQIPAITQFVPLENESVIGTVYRNSQLYVVTQLIDAVSSARTYYCARTGMNYRRVQFVPPGDTGTNSEVQGFDVDSSSQPKFWCSVFIGSVSFIMGVVIDTGDVFFSSTQSFIPQVNDCVCVVVNGVSYFTHLIGQALDGSLQLDVINATTGFVNSIFTGLIPTVPLATEQFVLTTQSGLAFDNNRYVYARGQVFWIQAPDGTIISEGGAAFIYKFDLIGLSVGITVTGIITNGIPGGGVDTYQAGLLIDNKRQRLLFFVGITFLAGGDQIQLWVYDIASGGTFMLVPPNYASGFERTARFQTDTVNDLFVVMSTDTDPIFGNPIILRIDAGSFATIDSVVLADSWYPGQETETDLGDNFINVTYGFPVTSQQPRITISS